MAKPSAGTLELNVKAYGAKGDGVADDTAEIQAAITDAVSTTHARVLLPRGTYLISSTLTAADHIYISGAGVGAEITGNLSGALFHHSRGGSGNSVVALENLGFVNTHATGTGVRLADCISPTYMFNCGINAHKALLLEDSCITTSILSCRFVRSVGSRTGSYGIQMSDHTNVVSCDVVNFEKGISSDSVGFTILGGRFEVNTYGLHVSGQAAGTISGITCEANDYGIYLEGVAGVTVEDASIMGSNQAPSGASITAIHVAGSNYSTNIIGAHERGTHGTAFINVPFAFGQNNLTIMGCNAAGGGAFSFGNLSGITVINCATGSTHYPDVIRAPIIATASLPAAAGEQDGRVVIEDAGAGNRNLILYAGGERFRIDGGAAV